MSYSSNISEKLFKEASEIIPGGVNSPVRSFGAVGGKPIFIKKAMGPYLFDEDGNKYIDYVGSFGPLIFGHSNEEIINAAREAMGKGTTFGACHKDEIKLAKLITETIPSMEMVRLTNSGTEATMSCIRLARAFTRKDKIIKFQGCYHGHADYLLVKAGSGASTFGTPSSPGVPDEFSKNTLLAEFNDIESVRNVFAKNPNSIAAIILEPVPANMGTVLPNTEFLREIKKIAHENKTLMIFDEVVSGYRISLGGAQEHFDVQPDMTCIGKIIGGGFPVGAFGGRKEIMSMLSPMGPVYQAGTLSGNPVGVAAGIKTIELLIESSPNLYKELNEKASYIKEKFDNEKFANIRINQIGSMLTFFFSKNSINNYSDVISCDNGLYGKFFNLLLSKGIMLPPSQFETMFVSTAHNYKDLDYTIDKCIESALAIGKNN
ncbi:MAG: glutamate-1-semialdehyde 2,1-aminomutase [Thermodesulfobacteriota bacterium]|nr:glutamate-1-semialdehyde 2,1-aminomutase [Thermodesulfobacteriota bacterium]